MDMYKTERKLFTKEEKQSILVKTGCKCAHCGLNLNIESMTVEHIFPIHKGGTNEEFNLVALCKECNNHKSNYIYDISDYYTYILSEYHYEYIKELNKAKLNGKFNDELLDVDAKLYTYIPDKFQRVLSSMIARGTSRKKINTIINNSRATLKLERAYTADAIEIMNLIDYLNKKGVIKEDTLYTNEYIILNAIKQDYVYVLRSSDKICGAFIFKRLTEDTKLDILQLNNMEEITRLQQKYIMTFGYVDLFALPVYGKIMNDFMVYMVNKGAIPIYFNLVKNISAIELHKHFIIIPYELDGVLGEVEFMPKSRIESNFREMVQHELDRGALTQEEIDNWITMLLDKSDLDNIEQSLERYNYVYNLHKKLEQFYNGEDKK